MMDEKRLAEAVVGLCRIMARLREPGGCPWDAQQTESTIKMYLLEEAYEVLDAVETGFPDDVCQELGDLLFQILFLTRLAEERGEFDFVRVIEGISEKMVRRHPHVFGSEEVRSAEEVARNWERIKQQEKGKPSSAGLRLRAVPSGLPALLRAHRLSRRAKGAAPARISEILKEADSRFKQVEKLLSEKDPERFGRELGALFFVLAELSAAAGQNAEDLLRSYNERFIERVEGAENESTDPPEGTGTI